MSFNPEDCAIPTFYCGDQSDLPARKRGDDKYYTRHGTPRECLSKGFGAGMITERLKTLPESTLQQIKYVGDVYDRRFRENGINTVDGLILYAKGRNPIEIDALLRKVLTKKGGAVDQRALNSVLLFLYKNGVQRIPSCKRL